MIKTAQGMNQADGADERSATERGVVPSPVFILGILPRCGSNLLFELLKKHPACSAASGRLFREDYLLYFARELDQYSRQVLERRKFDRSPAVPFEDERRRLLEELGRGICGYLNDQASAGDGVVITKTPQVRNIHLFPDLFPQSPLIVLVRDGRSVAESFVRSFGGSYGSIWRKWTAAASRICGFVNGGSASEHSFVIVKYEDLVTARETELRRIFRFLGWDEVAYDYTAAVAEPIHGSCESRQYGGLSKMEKREFAPLRRWDSWPIRRHQQFNWIAGRQMAELGYDIEHADVPAGICRRLLFRSQEAPWRFLSLGAAACRWLGSIWARWSMVRRLQRFRQIVDDAT